MNIYVVVTSTQILEVIIRFANGTERKNMTTKISVRKYPKIKKELINLHPKNEHQENTLYSQAKGRTAGVDGVVLFKRWQKGEKGN